MVLVMQSKNVESKLTSPWGSNSYINVILNIYLSLNVFKDN